tara:strand:- start:9395 stop:10708 length:1314 start_codon:yes stop_codon:yes gene_type:complete
MVNLKNYITVLERYEDDIRLNKIGACWLFSQSQMKEHGCKRKWSYSQIIGISDNETSTALLYGVGWHVIMEHSLLRIKNNDKCITVDEGIEYCETVARDYLNSEYDNIPMEEIYKQEWIESTIDRYKRGIVGWVKHWREVHKEYEVIAVEQTLLAPVLDPYTNDVYKPRNSFLIEKDYMYPCGVNDTGEKVQLEMPYYKIGRADAIVRKRGTTSLFILDHKTTSQPKSYSRKFLFDMQLASYCALLNYEIQEGELQDLKGFEIKGVIWDLCHSKIPDRPSLLKSGKLSTAKNKLVPSWIFEEAIEYYDLDRSDYDDHINDLKITDHNYFQLLEVSVSNMDISRAYLEDYATARSMHETRLNLHKCDDIEFNFKAPRYPICEQYQHCKYSKYCLPNTDLSKLFHDSIKKDKKIYWKVLTDKSECITIDNEGEQISLPF